MLSINHLAVILMMVFALLLGVALITISALLGRVKPDAKKLSVYECGIPPSGENRERYSVKFYLIAIFFLIFDIEVVFLYPWALIFKHNLHAGPYLLIEMFLFLGVLIVGYLYIWKKGGFNWTS